MNIEAAHTQSSLASLLRAGVPGHRALVLPTDELGEELFDSCGASGKSQEFLKRLAQYETGTGRGLEDLHPETVAGNVTISAISPALRSNLYRIGQALGLDAAKVDLLLQKRIEGAAELKQVRALCRTISDLARLVFLEECAAHPERANIPLEFSLTELRRSLPLRTDGGRFPLTVEKALTLLARSSQELSAMPPEAVSGIDEFNMLFARLFLGVENSLISRPWSAVRAAENEPAAEDLDRRPILVECTHHDAGNQELKFPLRSLLRRLTVDESDRALQSICSDTETVLRSLFRTIPPLSDDRLYTLAACAVSCWELGLRGIELKPQNSLDACLSAAALQVEKDSPASHPELGVVISELDKKDQFTLSFLISEIGRHYRPEDKNRAALSVRNFLEEIGERPFPFEDLLGAASLTVALHRLRASQSSIEIHQPAKASFDKAFFDHLCGFRAAYLSDRDLREMGLEQDRTRAGVLFKSRQAQHLGLLNTRKGALSYACMLASTMGLRPSSGPDFLNRCGAELGEFVSMRLSEETAFHNYRIKHYHSVSRVQFTENEEEESIVHELRDSGNYPALNREMALCGVTPELIVDRLRNGHARNLVEIENFCATLQAMRKHFPQMQASLRDTLSVVSSAGTYALVERSHDTEIKRIAVCMGYQSSDHVGMGLRHVIHQRMKDGSISCFRRDGDTEEDTVRHFIEDAVLYAAGAGMAKVPSRLHPETHTLLSSPVRGTPGHYLSLVLARTVDPANVSGETVQVVTALYHTSAKALRSCLLRELKGWIETSVRTSASDYRLRLAEVLSGANALLADAGQRKFTEEEIGSELPTRTREAQFATGEEICELSDATDEAAITEEAGPAPARAMGPRFGAIAPIPPEASSRGAKDTGKPKGPERVRARKVGTVIMRAAAVSAPRAPSAPPPEPAELDNYMLGEEGCFFHAGMAQMMS